MKTIELKKMKRAFFMRISTELLKHFAEMPEVELSVHDSFIEDMVTLRVVQEMLGNIHDTISIKYPTTWVDAFKERYFRGRLLERFPVAYTKRTMTKRIIYPDMIIPDQKCIVMLDV
jgi:hypothetical protein